MLIHDRPFELFIASDEIAHAVVSIAAQLNTLFRDKNPLFVIILNGSYIFGADLTRQFEGPCEVSFTKIKSYTGMEAGEVSSFSGFNLQVNNRHVILVEDIVDTGKTLYHLLNEMQKMAAASITTVALLQKKVLRPNLMKADIFGFEIPDVFVVGYGLDYDEVGRNLKDIWKVVD